MDIWAPIHGITVDRFAELSAEIANENDPEKQAGIVGAHGVQRPDWEAARAGWTARVQDMSLLGAVATRYWPLYHAAVQRKQAGPQPAPYNAQAQDAGAQVGNAFNSLGNAVGSFFDGAVGAFAPGARVTVQWNDGNRYPATVSQPLQNGQLEVAFPDGRRVWVPQGVVSAIY